MQLTLTLANEGETARFAEALAAALLAAPEQGLLIALNGTLGAGKTRLVQYLAGQLGIDPASVTSPTFVLCQRYWGTRELIHLDAYRLADDDEFLQLGPEEFFDSTAVTCMEWADRVRDCLPADRLNLFLEVLDTERRAVTLTAGGPHSERVLRHVADRTRRFEGEARASRSGDSP